MAKRITLPRSMRGKRCVYRVWTQNSRTYRTQKREAVRVAARAVRRQPSLYTRYPADVHALIDNGTKWQLIAQVLWSPSRRAPVLQEL